jgi:hypothetical protein
MEYVFYCKCGTEISFEGSKPPKKHECFKCGSMVDTTILKNKKICKREKSLDK